MLVLSSVKCNVHPTVSGMALAPQRETKMIVVTYGTKLTFMTNNEQLARTAAVKITSEKSPGI